MGASLKNGTHAVPKVVPSSSKDVEEPEETWVICSRHWLSPLHLSNAREHPVLDLLDPDAMS